MDVNRNFDFLWSSGIGTSADEDQFTYKGPAAFSEPESRNVRSLLDSHDHISYFVDVHSSGELILYSWGDDENQVHFPDQNFLNPAFDGKRGVVGDSVYREFIVGADQATLVDDYAYSRHRADSTRRKVYGFTLEFGEQFVPPIAEMRRIMADVAAALTELCRRAVTS